MSSGAALRDKRALDVIRELIQESSTEPLSEPSYRVPMRLLDLLESIFPVAEEADAPDPPKAKECGCGPADGLYRYCDTHNPCFAGQPAARAPQEPPAVKVRIDSIECPQCEMPLIWNHRDGGSQCVYCLIDFLRKQAQESRPAPPLDWQLRIDHARKQGAADGFQTGWHAALKRIIEGDSAQELGELVPSPSEALRPAPAALPETQESK